MTKLEEIAVKYPMDVGAACPIIFRDDLHLTLLFYIDLFSSSEPVDILKERDTENDTGIAIMNFKRFYIHKFGTPNDETLSGHPYYKIGLKHYSFLKVEDSDWIKEIMRIASNHPYFDESRYGNLNHYILTFKEGVFECIAEDFTLN
ncbi:hypothetical protein [Flagellimonas sp.]|uniref:hypothetical protein n=1 Tax=Flagellimonas sp. TaxID=2058762 RepID=UPI003BADB1DA